MTSDLSGAIRPFIMFIDSVGQEFQWGRAFLFQDVWYEDTEDLMGGAGRGGAAGSLQHGSFRHPVIQFVCPKRVGMKLSVAPLLTSFGSRAVSLLLYSVGQGSHKERPRFKQSG